MVVKPRARLRWCLGAAMCSAAAARGGYQGAALASRRLHCFGVRGTKCTIDGSTVCDAIEIPGASGG